MEREDPDTGREQQLRGTKLPQGLTEPPSLFGQALEEVLQLLPTVPEVKLIPYVDDLLLSGEDEEKVQEFTRSLLKFLGNRGLQGSREKLQFVENEGKYSGQIITKAAAD